MNLYKVHYGEVYRSPPYAFDFVVCEELKQVEDLVRQGNYLSKDTDIMCIELVTRNIVLFRDGNY